MMKEHPILFSAPMVRAILAGRKTQTRRVAKLNSSGRVAIAGHNWHSDDLNARIACPYGQPGDRLWGRETWSSANSEDGPVICYRSDFDRRYLMHEEDFLETDPTGLGGKSFNYRKTGTARFDIWAADLESEDKGWKPSIHMPRWASRITLEITGVRVERLQEISEDDAKAEGAKYFPDIPIGMPSYHPDRWSMEEPKSTDECLGNARFAFANFINKLHGGENWNLKPTLWDENPWVWCIEFKRIEGMHPLNAK